MGIDMGMGSRIFMDLLAFKTWIRGGDGGGISRYLTVKTQNVSHDRFVNEHLAVKKCVSDIHIIYNFKVKYHDT